MNKISVVYEKRLPNDLALIAQQLASYRDSLEGIVIESTYNWYWLVDGLMDEGHKIHLANTAAIQQYEGLKYTDDPYDARWLAHLLRLGVLPQGHIYPKQHRPVRDLLRKRGQMVRQRTANLLSIQNLISRNTGSSMSANRVSPTSRIRNSKKSFGGFKLLEYHGLGDRKRSNSVVVQQTPPFQTSCNRHNGRNVFALDIPQEKRQTTPLL